MYAQWLSTSMNEEPFTYILTPATSSSECLQRVSCENLPSLNEAVENAGGKTGTLLIDRQEFVMDVLLSFARTSRQQTFLGTEDELSSNGLEPPSLVVAASGHSSSNSAPPPLEYGVWPLVWAQFVRDVSRETLIVDGTRYDDPSSALERLQLFLDEAYEELTHRNVDCTTSIPAEAWQTKGMLSRFVNSAWGFVGKMRAAYEERVKRNEVNKAVQLAVLMAQQAILALPVELLHAQFSRIPGSTPDGANSAEPQTIFIGEPHVNKREDGEIQSHLQQEMGRRMTVIVGRRKRGVHSPFVRVEKSLHVFTVNEAAEHSTKLQLRVTIEIDFFSTDHVELCWEWCQP